MQKSTTSLNVFKKVSGRDILRFYESCPVFPGKADKRLHWPFPDPASIEGSEEVILSEFRKVRDNIKAKIKEIFN